MSAIPALFGGKPAFQPALDWCEIWPPTDDETAIKLSALYRSRRWSAFDGLELEFASGFASHHDSRHGVFTVNGTVTLQCALGAHAIGPGDEVIVPALTWYASAMAPHYIGATPVLVDVDPATLCIDPQKVEEAVTQRTRAIIPVHLYGSMADMDRIMEIARKHDLIVIEDCAHGHGGIWNGKRLGSIGNVGSFSFQHSKTMASAEGGICITNDEQIAERIFRMTHIGYAPRQLPGKATSGPPPGLLCYPFRATAFQALILSQQLPVLDQRLELYGQAVSYLEDRLSRTTKIRFQERGRRADLQSYFGWLMIFDDPEYAGIPLGVIQKAIEAEGLPVLRTWDPVYRFILFNVPPHTYRVADDCAVTEQLVSRSLWLLHAYLGLGTAEIERMADALEKVCGCVDQLRRYDNAA